MKEKGVEEHDHQRRQAVEAVQHMMMMFSFIYQHAIFKLSHCTVKKIIMYIYQSLLKLLEISYVFSMITNR